MATYFCRSCRKTSPCQPPRSSVRYVGSSCFYCQGGRFSQSFMQEKDGPARDYPKHRQKSTPVVGKLIWIKK